MTVEKASCKSTDGGFVRSAGYREGKSVLEVSSPVRTKHYACKMPSKPLTGTQDTPDPATSPISPVITAPPGCKFSAGAPRDTSSVPPLPGSLITGLSSVHSLIHLFICSLSIHWWAGEDGLCREDVLNKLIHQ